MKHKTGIVIIVTAFGLALTDEIIKYFALKRLPEEGSLLVGKIIDLAIHKNYGIAFNIPLARELTIFVTTIIIAVFIYSAFKQWHLRPAVSVAAALVIAGALGNLFDRITYGFTVDYIILFTRSAINLSDLLILSGIVWLVLGIRKTK